MCIPSAKVAMLATNSAAFKKNIRNKRDHILSNQSPHAQGSLVQCSFSCGCIHDALRSPQVSFVRDTCPDGLAGS